MLTMPVSQVSKRRTLIVGHRGASGLAPENTLAAFRLAADLGIDGVEFDVQRTADGHLVVFHDDELDRTSSGTGLLRDKTLAELANLDAGSWFNRQFAGEKIPTLEAMFDQMRGNQLLLFLEMKDPHLFPGMEAEVAAMIRRYGFEGRTQVRSFYHPSLHEFYKIAPDIAISELWYSHMPAAGEITYPTLNMLYSLLTPEIIAEVHARNQKVDAWTVNDVEIAEALIKAGIDGITTDFPDRMVKLENPGKS